MTARWFLFVGPRWWSVPHRDADGVSLRQALQTLDVLRVSRPSVRLALYVYDATTGWTRLVLLVRDGRVRVDRPADLLDGLHELLTEEVPPPADPAVGATSDAAFKSPVFVRCSIPVR